VNTSFLNEGTLVVQDDVIPLRAKTVSHDFVNNFKSHVYQGKG
jgi:hypothetical protein